MLGRCLFLGDRNCSEAERRLVESWLCFFDDSVFCPFPKIPKSKRVGSVCLGCSHYARFQGQMDEEDERFWAEVDEIGSKEVLSCYCDRKPCGHIPHGSCFEFKMARDGATPIFSWVCPRFDVNRASGAVKDVFLSVREGGLR